MNRDQNTFERIESYLNQSLNAEEHADFERQIDSDPVLKQEVELHRSLYAELNDIDSLEFRKKVVEIGKNHNNQQPKSSFFSWKIAASLLVLIGLSVYLWLKPTTGEDLFETYYKAYPVEDMVRGENTTDNDEILQRYTNGNYNEVLADLKRLSKENPNNETLQLYLGNSYLNLDHEEEAIIVFQNITKQSKYYEDGQWYLALAYIKHKDFKKAKECLNWLIAYDGPHKKNAQELLHKITTAHSDDF